MLKVRLQRVGRKNDPSFRVVVTDSKRGPKSGDYIETVGSHNPRTKKTAIKGDRIQHWMNVGAQASPTVHNMLVREKIIDGKMINVLPKKSPVAKESEEEKTTETAEAIEQSPTPDASAQTEEKAEGEGGANEEASADVSTEGGTDEALAEKPENPEDSEKKDQVTPEPKVID